MQTITKQSVRLKEFIEDLGMTPDGFRKSCQIRSPSSMTKIIKEGKSPSLKLLQKIINTYPQLNRDWVLTGVGEMYLPQFQFHNNVSKGAYQASQTSQYDTINSNLINHDFALNEIVIKLQQTISNQNEHMLLLSNKIEKLNTRSDERFEELKIGQYELDNQRVKMINDKDLERTKVLENYAQIFTEVIKNMVETTRIDLDNQTSILDTRRKATMTTIMSNVKEEIINTLNYNTNKAIEKLGGFSKISKPML